jgi:NAD(P)-dependent dehydrogenase (short-subunit alcohol dehydrogenase family)
MSEFDGLVALVTGGSSGIGAATAQLLASRGAAVAILDRQPPAEANGHLFQPCNITDRAAVFAAVQQVAETLGGLDIVVNNAGIGTTGDVAANTDEEWRNVLDVNVVGTARVSAAALPYLRLSEHAAIVNLCSIVSHVGVPDRAVYAASKGALLALTLAMAADHVGDGIRVNAVSPGTADTPWIGRLMARATDPTKAIESLKHRQPMGRLVTVDEVAYAICYLASPLASSTTGTVINPDGGMTGLRLPT